MSDLINTLQFFAAGGPGAAASAPGAAADTGVTTADAGRTDDQPGLSRELSGTQRPGQTDGTPGGEDWDSFMSRPENRSRLQSMMAERGKKAGEALRLAAQERERLAPLLAALAEQYGVAAGENGPDLAALERAVNARGARPSDTAEPPPAPGGAANPGEVGTADAESDPDAAQDGEPESEPDAAREARETFLQRHFLNLRRQAEALRAVFPDFSLERELCNPAFLRLTSPEGGLSVEDAFFSLHHREVLEQQAEAVARRVKADLAAAIRSGARPRENGLTAAAPARSTPDLHGMARAERLQYSRERYPG